MASTQARAARAAFRRGRGQRWRGSAGVL